MKNITSAWMKRAVFCLALLGSVGAAHAGRNCENKPLSAQALTKGMQTAQFIANALDKSSAQVVLLARAGTDLSKYGLSFSHFGFAYKTPEGVWRVLHKLNTCGTAVSGVYRQGLGEFFLDDMWKYDVAWVVPTPEIQASLMGVLTDTAKHSAFHHAPYSMVSYAWGQKYQQSNQWALEVLAAAIEPKVQNRSQAQAWLSLNGYTPTPLNISALTRLGGRVGTANIAFDDHPNEKRFADRIETITVDSVFSWMQKSKLGVGSGTFVGK